MGIEDRVERILRKLKLNKFYPFPFARSGFWQTVHGTYLPILKPSKPDAYHHMMLKDGDVLVLAENRPKEWQPGQRIMLLVHGLTGCYQSTYMQRMCRRMTKKGFLVLRLNLRFCGPGRGLARKAYHAGVSDDTREVLEWIKIKFPDSPVTQVGFSLGGNVTLKMAGEDGSRPRAYSTVWWPSPRRSISKPHHSAWPLPKIKFLKECSPTTCVKTQN